MYRSRVLTWELNDVAVRFASTHGISNGSGIGFDSDESTSGCQGNPDRNDAGLQRRIKGAASD